jgi:ParB/RepB/Spo0J family partition protein
MSGESNELVKIKIDDIKIGERHRRDLGDITSLAQSIAEVGLLHPVVVTTDNVLVSGFRRIEACKKLGWDEIPVHRVSNLDEALLLLKAERDENVCRKDLTPSEAVAIARVIEPLEREAAQRRMLAGRPCANLAQGLERGKSRDKVAAAVGMGHTTLKKAQEIVAAAEANPEFSDLVALMDNKSVDKAYKEYRRRKQKLERSERVARLSVEGSVVDGVIHGDFRDVAATLDDGCVSLIIADPPYARETLHLYRDLAAVAERLLIPGGALVVYAAGYALPEIMAAMDCPGLRFWWPLVLHYEGEPYPRMREYGVIVHTKLLLWWIKPPRRDRDRWIHDLISRPAPAKSHHEWEQSEYEAEVLIDALTDPGELVFDPFCGSGTTAVVAKRLGRRYLTTDIDADAIAIASARLKSTTSG